MLELASLNRSMKSDNLVRLHIEDFMPIQYRTKVQIEAASVASCNIDVSESNIRIMTDSKEKIRIKSNVLI